MDRIAALLDGLVGNVDPGDPRGAKRLQIMDAAAPLFAEVGYRRASMDEVAKRANVAKGTLYLYFERKIDLLIAVSAREKRAYFDTLRDVFDESLPAGRRLKRYVVSLLLAVSKMPVNRALLAKDELQAVVAEMPKELFAQGVRDRVALVGPMIEAVAGRHRWTESELRDRVDVVGGLGLLSPHLATELMSAQIAPERYAEILADLVVDGLSRKEQP